MGRCWGEILDVVRAEGETLAGSIGFKKCGRREEGQSVGRDRKGGEREDAVEPESVADDTSDVAQGVPELGGSIGGLIEGFADDCEVVSTNVK